MDSDAPTELPFGTDYAKSNRASCAVCKDKIEKGELRMSIRVQSVKWDGVQDRWHHYECFWRKPKQMTEASIRGLEGLRWEDQEKIREKIAEHDSPKKPEANGKKAEENGESSKTNGKKAKGRKRKNVEPEPEPEEPTPQKENSKLIVDYAKSDKGKCGECANKMDKGSMRIKYKNKFYHPLCLKKVEEVYIDKAENIQSFADLEETDQTQLKDIFKPLRKAEKAAPVKKARLVDPPERLEVLRTQSEILWKTLEAIRGMLTKHQIESLMKENGTHMPHKCTLEQGLEYVVDLIAFGSLPECRECKQKMLRWNLELRTYKCCTYISDYTRCPGFIRDPVRGNFVLPKDMEDLKFLTKYNGKKLLPDGRQYSLSVINNEVVVHKPSESSKKKKMEEEENRRCIVKNGCTVDPKCRYAEDCHVYIDKDKKPWQALLTAADLASGKNSYYKVQLLEDDHRSEYYVFRSWGRVGTTGGSKTEEFDGQLEDAKRSFKFHFHEKSQNHWENVDNFVKAPGGMELVEMDVDAKKVETHDQLDPKHSKSALPIQTLEVLSLFFNVKLMAKELAEFDLDTEKLPLAKLSRKQILRAHSILSELSKVLVQDRPSRTEILDFSNQFYSVMPHASGVGRLPMIDNLDLLKTKIDMLDSLLNLEIAYKMIEKKSEDGEDVDVFDRHYLSLSCKLELISLECPDAKLIQRYVTNGHMSTHRFKVKIKNIFKVERKDEAERFEKYKNLHNKQLLWHGSRTSNFAGILSKGLKIAPPEAPVNGYMFGKGIYFADCLSKSAQYCSTPGRSDVFLLLAEVALGVMQLEKYAKSIVTPDAGYNSVKALGGTAPDDKQSTTLNGVKVPIGKAQSTNKDNLSLLYNEYIVYDEAQAILRYLIHAEMEY